MFGRKAQTVIGTLICGVCAGAIGLLPTGAWVGLAVLRFLVGFGLAAGVTPGTDHRRRADADAIPHRA